MVATALDLEAFLQRIGVPDHGRPSVEALFTLHAAYVETVPYESVQFQLGRKAPLAPHEVAERIISREAGGYCYQLNGTLAAVLTGLGYQVTQHRAGVQHRGHPAGINGNHLVLTVTGLPESPDTTWLVDAGLGEGLHVPLPLRVGSFEQEPFVLALRPSQVTADGWRLDHDQRSGMQGMDFDNAPTDLAGFSEYHQYLSTSPDSSFVRVCSAFLRTPATVHILRALTLSTVHADQTHSRVLETSTDWYAALRDVFGLPMRHLSPAERNHLWHRAFAQHKAFLAR